MPALPYAYSMPRDLGGQDTGSGGRVTPMANDSRHETRVRLTPGYCWRTPSAENCAWHMPLLKVQEPGEANAAIKAMSRGNRFANSIRPFAAHETQGAILLTRCAQKRSPETNVELVGSQEVLNSMRTGRPRDRNRRDIDGHHSGLKPCVTSHGVWSGTGALRGGATAGRAPSPGG